MAVAPADVPRETYGGLREGVETPEEALQRLEARDDFAKVIGTDDGQRLLAAASNQVEAMPNGGVKRKAKTPAPTAAAAPEEAAIANGAAVEAFSKRAAARASKHADAAAADPLPAKNVAAPTSLALRIVSIEISANVRGEVGDLSELAASIREHGILQPITVTPIPGAQDGAPGFRVLEGHRRLAAAALAGYETVPVLVEHRAELGEPGAQRSVVQLVENLQRADLNPIDEARAIAAILEADKKLTHAQVATWVGKDRSWVTNALRLLETAPEVQTAVLAGTVTATHARAIAGIAPDLQPRLLESVVDRKLSAHETERQAQYFKEQEKAIRAREETAQKRATDVGAKLEKVANRETAQVGIADYAGAGSDLETALIQAGWKAQTNGYSWTVVKKAGECGCSGVWRVDVTYAGKVELHPACNSDEHAKARREEQEQRWKADVAKGNAERRAELDALEAAKAAVRGAIVAILSEDPPSPLARRILIYSLFQEEVDGELVARYLPDVGDAFYDLDDGPWRLLEAVPDDDLAGLQTSAVVEFVTGYAGGAGVRGAVDAWRAERDGVIAAAASVEAPAAKARKRLGARVRLDDPLFVGDVEYVVLSITGRGADPEATHIVEAVRPGPVKAVDWKDSRIRLQLGSLVADKAARVWRADEQLALAAPEDEDLRPTGEVNVDALRGEADRAVIADEVRS